MLEVFFLFFCFFFPFFHEDNILNVKNFYFRTVRQVAQEQFFLMCTRCCMGHRPLLFFITLLFTVLGVRHFKNMLIIVIHSYTRNSQEFMVLAYIKVRAVYIYLINISNCPYRKHRGKPEQGNWERENRASRGTAGEPSATGSCRARAGTSPPEPHLFKGDPE